MNGYYESMREGSGLVLQRIDRYTGFPVHFHDNVEVLIFFEGKGKVQVNKQEFPIEKGLIVFADSYDAHGVQTDEETPTKVCIVIIPYRYLINFNYYKKGMDVLSPTITDVELANKLAGIMCEFGVNEENGGASEWRNSAAADLFLSLLFERLTFGKSNEKAEHALLKKVLRFAHEHYKEDISLNRIAKELGYTEEHISRVFHRYVKESLSKYINELRYQEVERLCLDNGKRMMDCIYEAGFQTQQTYYRYKKERGKLNKESEKK